MTYIEIQDGISIRIDEIEAIVKVDNNKCTIYTHHNKYEALFPYETLMQMIKSDETVSRKLTNEQKMIGTMDKLDKVLNNAQHFVG